MYRKLISEATGVTDTDNLAALEDIMRHDIFHSTLDWQTVEQLRDAAKQALAIHCELIAMEIVNSGVCDGCGLNRGSERHLLTHGNYSCDGGAA